MDARYQTDNYRSTSPPSLMRGPFWLDHDDTSYTFPPVVLASEDPNGLLALGGDLAPERIISAYRQGIFPWYSADQPILWWSPDPRTVLVPSQLKVSRSLRKSIKKAPFRITIDHCFEEVLQQCAAPRSYADGTWITTEMQQAYARLHHAGIAHSFEAWQGDELVGGLYGLAIGRIFFGESMFSHATNASKIAFVHSVRQLERWGYALIDCQVATEHLHSLGATEIPRQDYIKQLQQLTTLAGHPAPWHFDDDFNPLNSEGSDE